MSKQVTNLEIEDVLSSIRRLVAEGDKLRSTPAKPVAEPRDARGGDPLPLRAVDRVPSLPVDAAPILDEEPVATPDLVESVGPVDEAARQAPRFVLTPALRVAEPRPSTVLLWEEAGDDPAPDARSGFDAADSADQVETPAETGPETSLLSPEAMDEAPVADPDQIAGVEGDAPAPVLDGRSRLEATIAELEAAITAKQDDWEPDGSEVTPVMDWASGAAEPAFLSSRQGSHRAAVEHTEEVPDWRSDTASDAYLRVNADDDADDWRADTAEEASGHLGEDLHRTEPRSSDTGPDRADDPVAASLSEDEILDEDALRNLVVEIVRQELQGALGERITRNVRKLVRREIYRMLSSQEFD